MIRGLHLQTGASSLYQFSRRPVAGGRLEDRQGGGEGKGVEVGGRGSTKKNSVNRLTLLGQGQD